MAFVGGSKFCKESDAVCKAATGGHNRVKHDC